MCIGVVRLDSSDLSVEVVLDQDCRDRCRCRLMRAFGLFGLISSDLSVEASA